jgi:hypothetical protein
MKIMITPGDPPGGSKFSAHETALYTQDMLQALKCIAERQQHHRLAELIDAAVVEAARLAESSE